MTILMFSATTMSDTINTFPKKTLSQINQLIKTFSDNNNYNEEQRQRLHYYLNHNYQFGLAVNSLYSHPDRVITLGRLTREIDPYLRAFPVWWQIDAYIQALKLPSRLAQDSLSYFLFNRMTKKGEAQSSDLLSLTKTWFLENSTHPFCDYYPFDADCVFSGVISKTPIPAHNYRLIADTLNKSEENESFNIYSSLRMLEFYLQKTAHPLSNGFVNKQLKNARIAISKNIGYGLGKRVAIIVAVSFLLAGLSATGFLSLSHLGLLPIDTTLLGGVMLTLFVIGLLLPFIVGITAGTTFRRKKKYQISKLDSLFSNPDSLNYRPRERLPLDLTSTAEMLLEYTLHLNDMEDGFTCSLDGNKASPFIERAKQARLERNHELCSSSPHPRLRRNEDGTFFLSFALYEVVSSSAHHSSSTLSSQTLNFPIKTETIDSTIIKALNCQTQQHVADFFSSEEIEDKPNISFFSHRTCSYKGM